MEIFKEEKISDNVFLREVDKFPNEIYKEQQRLWLVNDYPYLKWQDSLTEKESENLKVLSSKLSGSLTLRVGLFVNDELRGWCFGWQDSANSFYMGASGVDPELRRNGYYSRLIQYVLNKTQELGFQRVSSQHILTNNAVIIAKLKHGFTIKGIDVDAVMGALLRLEYHHNPLMKKAAQFRVGAMKDAEIFNKLMESRS